MFEISLSDTSLIRNSIPIIAEIIDEGVFKIDKNGLSLISPDRTMVAVVDFKLLSSAFDKFKVEEERELGLNLGNLVAILKRVGPSDKLTIKSGKENKLEIIIEGNGKRKFEIPLIDISVEKPPIEQLNFTAEAELDSSILEQGIADADVVSDSVIFETEDDLFRMLAEGDVSSTELEIKKGEEGLLKLKTDGKVKARYPLEYLKKMIKAAKLSKQAELKFGTDFPMRLDFKVLDKISLGFVLAPRVEE